MRGVVKKRSTPSRNIWKKKFRSRKRKPFKPTLNTIEETHERVLKLAAARHDFKCVCCSHDVKLLERPWFVPPLDLSSIVDYDDDDDLSYRPASVSSNDGDIRDSGIFDVNGVEDVTTNEASLLYNDLLSFIYDMDDMTDTSRNDAVSLLDDILVMRSANQPARPDFVPVLDLPLDD